MWLPRQPLNKDGDARTTRLRQKTDRVFLLGFGSPDASWTFAARLKAVAALRCGPGRLQFARIVVFHGLLNRVEPVTGPKQRDAPGPNRLPLPLAKKSRDGAKS